MALNTNITLTFDCDYTYALDLSTRRDRFTYDFSTHLASGTGADQADTLFHDERTLADAANETLNLYDSGTLTDSVGNALTMETLKVLLLENTSSDASLKVGAAASNAVGLFADSSDIEVIKPGGHMLWTAPDATGLDVTTNKNLKLEHDGTGSDDLVYRIVLIGVD